MAVYADDVLIVGVERDYDCLCLGEDKTSKQKRLLAKGKAQGKEKEPVEREPGKNLESSVVEVTCIEDSATIAASTKPNSSQLRSPETQSQDEKALNTTMQQMPHQPVYAHSPQPVGRGATPSNNIARTPTTGQLPFSGAQGGTSLCGNHESASTSQPRDGDVGWITSSEWDTFFDQQPFTPDTDQNLALNTTNLQLNTSSNTMSKGASTGGAAALHGSSAGASGSSSSINTSAAASGPAIRSPSSAGAGFGNFADTMEKDSVAQSTSCYVPTAPSITSTNDAPLSIGNPNPPQRCNNSLTNYPALNATPNAINQNQNQNIMSLNSPSTTQSSCLTAPLPTNHHTPPTGSAHNHNSLPQAAQQPANAFQVQQQMQGYANASMATSLQAPTPAQIQQPISNGGSVQGQQQGYSAVNTTPPGPSQPPVNSNSAAFFVNNRAQIPLQGTQLQSGNTQPLSFNNGAGVVSTPSNSQMTFNMQGFNYSHTGVPGRPQQPLCNGSFPLHSASVGTEHLQNDEKLARKLQEDEYIKGMRRSQHGDERLAMSLLANDLSIQQASLNSIPNATQYPQQQQQQLPPPSAMQMQTVAGPSNFSTNATPGQQNAAVLTNASKVLGGEQQEQGPGENTMKHPTCWSQCPNCPSDVTRKYHLIDVEQGSPEWNVVCQPLFNSGFNVVQVQRIQNETLWQRLCFEKQLMLRDRPSCNEKFLYHTSRAEVAVICEEGLDPRLSRNGLFGSGIYFSDNPIKCDKYWSSKVELERTMFCCRVLLGDTKIYPKGKSEQLKREPPKENPQPGEPKTYDSVKGNISGQDEFVVYNAYRVMPEYVIKYYSSSLEAEVPPPIAMRLACRRRQLQARRLSVQLPYPNPHFTFNSLTPPVCPHRTPPVPFYRGPSNYYNPMAVHDTMGFGASPIMPPAPQPCYGVWPPMIQSPVPYSTRST